MAQVNQSFVWMVDDVSPREPSALRFLGKDMGSRPFVRPLFNNLQSITANWTASNATSRKQQAVVRVGAPVVGGVGVEHV